MLGEIPDAVMSRDLDDSGVGLFFTRDHPQERSLAVAVPADKPDPLALVHGETDIIEDDLPAVCLMDIAGLDHWMGDTGAPYGSFRISNSLKTLFSKVCHARGLESGIQRLDSRLQIAGMTAIRGYAFLMPSRAIAILPVRTNSLIPIGLSSSTMAAIFFSSPVISMV